MILEDNPRRRPQTFGGAVYLGVVAMALIGLAVTVVGPWRSGVTWIGAGLLTGGIFRLVLPEQRAGMLRVRRKAGDVAMLLAAGGALVVLAWTIPDQG